MWCELHSLPALPSPSLGDGRARSGVLAIAPSLPGCRVPSPDSPCDMNRGTKGTPCWPLHPIQPHPGAQQQPHQGFSRKSMSRTGGL